MPRAELQPAPHGDGASLKLGVTAPALERGSLWTAGGTL